MSTIRVNKLILVGALAATVQAKTIDCGGKHVDEDKYTCFGSIACPAPKTKLCGLIACYDPLAYHCDQGILIQGAEDNYNHLSTQVLSGFDDVSGILEHERERAALASLSVSGVTLATVEEVKSALATLKIAMSESDVLLVLQNEKGPVAGLREYAAGLKDSDTRAKVEQIAQELGNYLTSGQSGPFVVHIDSTTSSSSGTTSTGSSAKTTSTSSSGQGTTNSSASDTSKDAVLSGASFVTVSAPLIMAAVAGTFGISYLAYM